MRKQIKISCLLLGLSVLSVLLHNVISALLKTEEPVFFLLTFVFVFGFAISIIYNLILFIGKKLSRKRAK